jgi:predicted RNase H-like HicB family nuclease
MGMKIKVVLEPSDEGGFTAYVPSLPGCITEGETVEEALRNAQEAIALYLEPAEDDWCVGEKALVHEIEL